MGELTELPGGAGVAVRLAPGEALRVINTHGSQVVDAWAVSADDPIEVLSVEHTRRVNERLHPTAGASFWSNRRNAMLDFVEDSFAANHPQARHDMLAACCDPWLYAHLGCAPGHASCAENFATALRAVGVDRSEPPNPVNFWMNVVVDGERMTLERPLSRPGDHVLLRARMAIYFVMSACPMDVTPVNGGDGAPKPVHYLVERGSPA